MRNNRALLIIDMQQGAFLNTTHDPDGVIDRINALSKSFRNAGLPVIIIQHDGTAQGEFVKNTEEWKILPDLIVSSSDIIIAKTANDSFYKTQLGDTLNQYNVKEIFITGSATDFCIDATVHSALSKDYTVVIVSDAHTTEDKAHISAKDTVVHYNWVWQNLIPTNGRIFLKDAENVNKELLF